jgi:hypothetical protein
VIPVTIDRKYSHYKWSNVKVLSQLYFVHKVSFNSSPRPTSPPHEGNLIPHEVTSEN